MPSAACALGPTRRDAYYQRMSHPIARMHFDHSYNNVNVGVDFTPLAAVDTVAPLATLLPLDKNYILNHLSILLLLHHFQLRTTQNENTTQSNNTTENE